ncbi:MAG TPA: cation-translocating P-type ATPase [Thermoanaerobaculia bacterium]
MRDTRSLKGLSSAEARARLLRDGPNEIASARHRGVVTLAREAASEPMVLLLLAAGGIYLALGDRRDAFVLLGSILVVLGITFVQGYRTERAVERLRDLSSPRARVIRDSEQTRIAGREVVRGDLLIVSEGDRVAADGKVLWQSNLTTDESLLTGESVPVSKRAEGDAGAEAGEPAARVFSGTLVVSGQGLAEVTETGSATEMGRIGKSLGSIAVEKTPLQRETGRIVRRLGVAGIAVCALIVFFYARTRGNFLQGLLAGLAVAMSVLPEEFPVVLTVFLALGAWRISRRKVLTRRIPAIEALGAATVLCVDKTGTLTLNRMAVTRLAQAGQSRDVSTVQTLPEELHELVEFAVLASQKTPFDPTELAIREFGLRTLARTEHLHEDWELLKEYPLSRELLAVAHAWKARERGDFVVAAKGAPEAIADLCHLDASGLRSLLDQVEALASDGLRVLAVAKARFHPEALPPRSHDFDFELLGLVGLEDPIRPTVPASIEQCRTAGIRVVMITGDYPVTAARVAREIGLTGERLMTGAELDTADDRSLAARLGAASVFARVAPAQKLRLVEALKAAGEVVVMTGDGVNDAPALKAAHIGIAMGGRGTDVAREAAALVLLEDDFPSIVEAISLGRRIFDNLKKAMAYLVAVHVPIAGLALFPVLFGWPLLLMPVQIVFLELIIDPASSIAFEAEPAEADIMRRPPRSPRASLLPGSAVLFAALQGAAVLAVVLAFYAGGLARGVPVGAVRAAAFAALIVGNLGLILANRSPSKTILRSLGGRNPALWWIVGSAAATLGLVLAMPGLRDLFRFSEVRAVEALLGIGAGAATLVALELLNLGRLRRWKRAAS